MERRRRIVFDRIWVCVLSRQVSSMLTRVRSCPSRNVKWNKQDETLVISLHILLPSPTICSRWTTAIGSSRLALSAWPIDESKLCSESTAQRNRWMVLREQCIDRLEIEGIAIMDSWKTYAFIWTTNSCLTLIPCWSYSWGGEKYPSVCYISYLSAHVIHGAY